MEIKTTKVTRNSDQEQGNFLLKTGNETTTLSFKKLYINSKCSGLDTIHKWPAQAVGLELNEREFFLASNKRLFLSESLCKQL